MHKLLLTALVVSGLLSSGAAHARGGMAQEGPFNPDHIIGLPAEVREGIARVCGRDAHAQHYFATFLESARIIRLHFERAHCQNDQPLCNSAGCLHQDYISSGGHYRFLRSYYGPEND